MSLVKIHMYLSLSSCSSSPHSNSATVTTPGPSHTSESPGANLTSQPPPSKKKRDRSVELDDLLLSNLKSLEERRAARDARRQEPKDQESLFGEQVAATLC